MYFTSVTAAALVATVVAPITPSAIEASLPAFDKKSVAGESNFPDTKGHKYEAEIEGLYQAKIINGHSDGIFDPEKKLTRSDVVKILGKWLVAEGYKIPADAVSMPRFIDIAKTKDRELLEYAAVVKDYGIFKGSNGRLMVDDNITPQQTALVIVRAMNTMENVDLEGYVADQDTSDAFTKRDEEQKAIDVLNYFSITDEVEGLLTSNKFITRGEFAAYLFRSLQIDFDMVKGIPTIEKITSLNRTTIEIVFENAVKDIDLLTFRVGGLIVQNATLKEDGKTVELTTTKQKTGKNYIVTMNGKKQSIEISKPEVDDTDTGSSDLDNSSSDGVDTGSSDSNDSSSDEADTDGSDIDDSSSGDSDTDSSGSDDSNSGGSDSDWNPPPVIPPTSPDDGSDTDGSDGTPPVTPPTNPGGSLSPAESVKAVNAAKSADEVLNILRNSNYQPPFANLSASQQEEVADAVYTSKPGFGTNFGGYDEWKLNNIYKTAYDQQARQALAVVNAAANEAELEAALKNVPGLNLGGYNALTPAEKQAMKHVLTSKVYDTVAKLQEAIDAELAAPIIAPILAAINSSTDGDMLKNLLETNKDVLKLDTFSYDKLPAAEKVKVVETMLTSRPTGGYTIDSLRIAFVEASKVSSADETRILTARTVELVNEARALGIQYGIQPALNHDVELSKIAQIKAEDMAKNGYFAHESPTYGEPSKMMTDFGYSWLTSGENIASGQTTAEHVVDGWIKSNGHYANIMGSTYTQIGAGYAVDANGQTYWVHMFASK